MQKTSIFDKNQKIQMKVRAVIFSEWVMYWMEVFLLCITSRCKYSRRMSHWNYSLACRHMPLVMVCSVMSKVNGEKIQLFLLLCLLNNKKMYRLKVRRNVSLFTCHPQPADNRAVQYKLNHVPSRFLYRDGTWFLMTL